MTTPKALPRGSTDLAQMLDGPSVFHDPETGSVIVARHACGRRLLARTDLLKDPDKATPRDALMKGFKVRDSRRPEDHAVNMLWLDEPDHSRVRGPIARALDRRVAAFAPALQKIVDRVVRKAAAAGAFDLVSEFATPIPVRTIAKLVGVDRRRLDDFHDWSLAMNLAFHPAPSPDQTAARERAQDKFAEYFEALISRRRREPRDDLTSDLVTAGALNDTEIRVNLTALVVGGNLSTADLIASTAWLLLRQPGGLRSLSNDPLRVARAIEEALRVQAPVVAAQRVLAEDTQIDGVALHAGDPVVVAIQAANLDAEAFADPLRFDLEREHASHLSFGGGAHACIGARLARLEARSAIAGLAARLPQLSLAQPAEEPAWRPTPFFRGIESLAVRASA